MTRISKVSRELLALLISLLPINILRVFFWRIVFGYRIDYSATVGMFTVIAVDKATIHRGVRIGRFNRFSGPGSLEVWEGACIENRNEFSCQYWVLEPRFSGVYSRSCKIGAETLITSGHFVDITGGFELGDGSWIAGRDSQFWTHGAGVLEKSVVIGKDCYVGSAVRFAPGVKIRDLVIVGIGSVVTKSFDVSHALIAGCPAKVLKENYDWKSRNANDHS